MALESASPAINTGNSAAASSLTTDQRGDARSVNGTVDIGAFEVQTVSTTATTIAVTTSAAPTTYGDSVTFTAEVTSTSTPTGSVNFVIDGGTAVAGTAGSTTGTTATWTYTTSTLRAGTHTVDDLYFGGGNFTNSTGSLSGGQTVNKAVANIAVTTSATPTTFGDSVTFTATVNSTSTPTGSVKFVIDSGTAVAGTAGSTTGTTATWTYTTSTLTTGTHTVEAAFSGGGNFTNNTSTLSGGQTVNPVNPITTFTVTNINYSGTGSLGAAIAAAVAENDTEAMIMITFSGVAADSTIELNSSDLNTTASNQFGPTAFFIDGNSGTNITINGSGAPGLVIDGGSAVRLFAVASGNALTLENLTLEHGNATGAAGAAGAVSGTGAGGGVYVSDGGTFTALDCTFTNNNAQGGTGADTTSGPPPVDSGGGDAGYGGDTTSAFKNGGGGGDTSGASGGVSGTGGAGNGGGIFSNGGALTLDNDTFTANSAIGGTGPTDGQGLGGAIFADGGSLALLNDTISGNTAAQGGRGVYVSDGATATINNTIIGQSDTGVSDFVANGASTSGVGNLIRTQTGFSGAIVSTANPLLAALAKNGGPTETMALQSASPAINTGNSAAASSLTADQRGDARSVNGHVDIGAFEVQTVSTTATTIAVTTSAAPTTYGDSVTFTAEVTSTSTPTGSVNFVIDGGTAVAGIAGSTTGTTATWTYSTSALSAGSHTVEADYVRTGTFSDSTGTLSGGQTVNTAALTVTATNESMTYGG